MNTLPRDPETEEVQFLFLLFYFLLIDLWLNQRPYLGSGGVKLWAVP